MCATTTTTTTTLQVRWQHWQQLQNAKAVGRNVAMADSQGMVWNQNFGMEYGRYQSGMEWKILRMEWKTIFHISIPNPCYIFRAWYLQKKYIRMSGSDKHSHRSTQHLF